MSTLVATSKMLRKKSGLILEEASKQYGISKSSLSRFEHNEQKLSKDKINKILSIYKASIQDNNFSIEEDIKQIHIPLFYKNGDYKETFIDLKKREKLIMGSVYYPAFYVYLYASFVESYQSGNTSMDNDIIMYRRLLLSIDYLLSAELSSIFFYIMVKRCAIKENIKKH